MAEVIKRLGIKREKGYLYYIDRHGDVSRAKMARAGRKGGAPQKVAKAGIKKEEGYLYFIDKNGNIARARLARRGRRR